MTVYLCGKDEYLSWATGDTCWDLNDDQRDKYFILSLSGGKDSTALLLKCLQYDVLIHEVVYVDTGKEMPEMADHMRKLQLLLDVEGITYTRLGIDKTFEYWLGHHVKTKGKNKGKVGYGWPDMRNRWCTTLKLQTLKQHYQKILQEQESVEFVGIAYDELGRAEKNKGNLIKEYPLVGFEMEEEECLQYCYSQGFDWGGLYEKFARVSCYLCPLSRLSELKYVYKNYPELWEDMRRLDKLSYRQFRADYSLSDLEMRFRRESNQLSLFKEVV